MLFLHRKRIYFSFFMRLMVISGPRVCEGFISHIRRRRSPWQQKVIGRTLGPIRFLRYEWTLGGPVTLSAKMEINPGWSFSGRILRGFVLAPPTSSHPSSSCLWLLHGIRLKCQRRLWWNSTLASPPPVPPAAPQAFITPHPATASKLLFPPTKDAACSYADYRLCIKSGYVSFNIFPVPKIRVVFHLMTSFLFYGGR